VTVPAQSHNELRLPRLAVLGSFSAGKSALVNALIPSAQLPVEVLPCTAVPTLLRYADSECLHATFRDQGRVAKSGDKRAQLLTRSAAGHPARDPVLLVELGLRHPLLQQFELLDLPGYGEAKAGPWAWCAVLQTCTAGVVCVNAQRGLTSVDQAELAGLPQPLRDNLILVLTCIDQFDDPSEVAKLLDWTRQQAPAGVTAVLTTGNPPRRGGQGLPTGIDALRTSALQVAKAVQAPASRSLSQVPDPFAPAWSNTLLVAQGLLQQALDILQSPPAQGLTVAIGGLLKDLRSRPRSARPDSGLIVTLGTVADKLAAHAQESQKDEREKERQLAKRVESANVQAQQDWLALSAHLDAAGGSSVSSASGTATNMAAFELWREVNDRNLTVHLDRAPPTWTAPWPGAHDQLKRAVRRKRAEAMSWLAGERAGVANLQRGAAQLHTLASRLLSIAQQLERLSGVSGAAC